MKALLTCVIILLHHSLLAQKTNDEIDPSAIADDLTRYADDDLNYEELYENYLQLIADPLDINKSTPEELRLLNILSETQINSLFEYIAINGKLMSIYELQAVPEFDDHTIARLAPLVKVADEREELGKPFFNRIISKGQRYIVTRYERTVETARGYQAEDDQKQFIGSADKMYLRFRCSENKDYSFGFTAEKDAGEQLGWNTNDRYYGTDYWSYHAQVLNKKRLKNFIAGDFQYQFGQGLVLGNAFGLGKGGETVNTVRKTNVGFSPYTSVNEAGYMRGAATTYQLHKKIYLSAFYSNAKRDATVVEDSSTHFSSILVTGLHRTQTELDKRHRINEQNIGSIIQFKSNKTDAGLIVHSITFSEHWQRNPTPYNQFSFRGNKNENVGVYFNHTIHNVNVFMEAAHTIGGGSGVVAGAIGSIDPKLDMAMLFRNYERDYVSFYTNAFAESTTPQNETGMYWGWKYKFNRRYSLSAYVDLFTFPWLKFRTYKPSGGNEVLLRFQYQPSRKIVLYAQARQEREERNVGDDKLIYNTELLTKRNLLLNCDYTISENIRMKTRAQFSNQLFNGASTSGLAIMQDLIVKVRRFQVSTRFALFDTEDFDNRQYAYENDAWLAYSLLAYNGQGIRNYVMLQYKMSKSWSFWLRYSRTQYSEGESIGSGGDTILGNSRNDIKLQVKLSF